MALTQTLSLNQAQRTDLEGYLRKRNLRASVAQRMRILLMLADGASYRAVMTAPKTTAPTISLAEEPVRERGCDGADYTASRPTAAETHTRTQSPDSGQDAGAAAGWKHALEPA